MSEQRRRVLTGIRRALRRGPIDGEAAAALDRRLADRPRGPVPDLGDAPLPDTFRRRAEAANATVAEVATWSGVPAAVAAYLDPAARTRVALAPHPDLTALPWADALPTCTRTEGPADAATHAGISRAHTGIAETGTLILASGPISPTTLAFLPATHVVVLGRNDLVTVYEAAWDRLRRDHPAGRVPRTVNMITGPSRTADVEQTLQLGAHGPRALHIVLVADDDG